MKILILILLVSTVACSYRKESRQRIDTKTSSEEVRTVSEIHSRTAKMLDNHTELTPEEKEKLQKMLDEVVLKHQALRSQESQIVQLLLKKSLNSHKLTKEEKMDRVVLSKKLNEVYQEKANNIFSLTSQISQILDDSKNAQLNDDMMIFFRDLR